VQSDVTIAWRQLEMLKNQGKAKSIGVSNFTTRALQAIVDSCEVRLLRVLVR